MAWRKSRPVSAEAGFSLIEVTIAMVIMSVGLLALAAVVPALKSDVTHSDQRSRTTQIAQETAEWLHGLSYDDALLSPGNHTDTAYNVPNLTRGWVVEQNVPFTGVKKVTVSVTRKNQPAESASLVFLHAESGR